jgi:hypothetical protein
MTDAEMSLEKVITPCGPPARALKPDNHYTTGDFSLISSDGIVFKVDRIFIRAARSVLV